MSWKFLFEGAKRGHVLWILSPHEADSTLSSFAAKIFVTDLEELGILAKVHSLKITLHVRISSEATLKHRTDFLRSLPLGPRAHSPPQEKDT